MKMMRMTMNETTTHAGNLLNPPGFIHWSRAWMTWSSMPSYSRKYPIHSDSTMSTRSSKYISSTLPWRHSMMASNRLARTFARALWIMCELSTAYTLRAPARAANILRIPVPQPTSSTVYT